MRNFVRSRVSHHERRWTPEEDALIRKLYPDNGAQPISTELGLRPSLIRNRARWIGVALKTRTRRKVRAEANRKIGIASRQRHSLIQAAPKFLEKHEEFSRSWYLAQQHAFSEAMKLNPTERPS